MTNTTKARATSVESQPLIIGQRRAKALAVLVCSLGLILFGFVGLAQAQTYTILHSFSGTDGANPRAALVVDTSGNLYGTTAHGGAYGGGTVFKLDSSGNETVLHSFATSGGDGYYPYSGGLILDSSGNLYGTTQLGGAFGCGTVFELVKGSDGTYSETILHSFANSGGDGTNPDGGLWMDSSGNLYGTTTAGGTSGAGAVFELDSAGNETILHSFSGTDGGDPEAGLIADAAGDLYGTTQAGGSLSSCGSWCGTVFKLDTSGGGFSVLHDFTSYAGQASADGGSPNGKLVVDSSGNLYGTTFKGGDNGEGVVFKLDASGDETILQFFTGLNGIDPYAGLVKDSSGNLYGTTILGGAVVGFNGAYWGTVFKIDSSGNETVLHSFTRSNGDGGLPLGGLVIDKLGNIYGTTYYGGAYDAGIVFKIAPAITTTTMALTSSGNPTVYGQSVTLTAAVQPSALAATTPTGTVTFTDGTTTLASVSLTNGKATFTSSSFSVGAHQITASYSGDSSFAASTGALSLSVNPAQTKTTVTSSGSPAVLNGTITFTATVSVVSPGAGTPTGTVTFDDGTNLLGTVPLSASGAATFSTSSLALGSHTITAAYSGDSDFSGSTSTNLSQSVEYEPAGTLCDGAAGRQILPPIDPGGTSVFKQGSTVPAKFRVCDANGASIGTTGVVTSFYLLQIVFGTAATSVEDLVGTNNPDTAFRWDSTEQQWIFNISTKNLSAGSTYIYTIGLNDGTTINFQFGLR